MARKKKLAIFRTGNHDNIEGIKEQMETYRSLLGDRLAIYDYPYNPDFDLTLRQRDYLNNLLQSLLQYDVVGTNQWKGLVKLSEQAIELEDLEETFKKDISQMFEVDYRLSSALGRKVEIESPLYRYYERLDRLHSKTFQEVLNININDYEQIVLNGETVKDSEELIEFRKQEQKLLELVKV